MLNSVLPYEWASTATRLGIVAAVTVSFALLARGLRGVNRSGAWAGGLVCFALFAASGPAAFATLAVLFILTWASTRFGYRQKRALGVAERREGRNAWQVYGNLAVAALCSVAFGATGNRIWLIASVAALAEAATDTVASEVGQSIGQSARSASPGLDSSNVSSTNIESSARLITTWKRVPAGTDGGVTMIGSVAGLLAGLTIAAVAVAGRMISPSELWIAVVAGFAGMLVDSLLGATLQRRGWISNQSVNFFATLAAATMAFAAARIFP